ncbi:MAG: 30S ribosomal protein S4e [Methanobacteriaceae archaeon]|nr:30S ribosomal protein S4e [Methanobacteriaceae archaeon]
MAKMGSRKHLKRFKAPKSWPIHPKEDTWTVKPAPGSHAIEDSLSLMVIVRDVLGLADNSREAKRIINNGDILIDGKAKKDYKFPVGFMDILSIPKTGDNYRLLLDTKGRLNLHPISEEDAKVKLAKIVNKSTIKGGVCQLNLHDGRNVLVEEDNFAGQDVIALGVPEQEINATYKFEEGAVVLVIGGKHTGEIGKVKEINVNESSKPNTVIIEKANNDTFLTLKEYAFVIGADEPVISLMEVNQ